MVSAAELLVAWQKSATVKAPMSIDHQLTVTDCHSICAASLSLMTLWSNVWLCQVLFYVHPIVNICTGMLLLSHFLSLAAFDSSWSSVVTCESCALFVVYCSTEWEWCWLWRWWWWLWWCWWCTSHRFRWCKCICSIYFLPFVFGDSK